MAGTVNNDFFPLHWRTKKKETLYMDTTGALPAISLNGYQYFLILYDYDTRYIIAKLIKMSQTQRL